MIGNSNATVPDPDDAPDLSDAEPGKASWSIKGRAVSQAEGSAAMKAAARRGRPKLAITKIPVTMRLDQDIVNAFKQTGEGWQTRMNDALHQFLQEHPL